MRFNIALHLQRGGLETIFLKICMQVKIVKKVAFVRPSTPKTAVLKGRDCSCFILVRTTYDSYAPENQNCVAIDQTPTFSPKTCQCQWHEAHHNFSLSKKKYTHYEIHASFTKEILHENVFQYFEFPASLFSLMTIFSVRKVLVFVLKEGSDDETWSVQLKFKKGSKRLRLLM